MQDTEDLGIKLSLDEKLKDAIEKLQGAPLILTGDMESGKTLAFRRVSRDFPKANEYQLIEVPKTQIDENKARELRDSAKQNTILEGSSYQIEYIFSDLPVKYGEGEEWWRKWLGVFKRRIEAEISSSTGPLGTAARVEAKLSYDDATKLYEHYAKKVWGNVSDIESQDNDVRKRRMKLFLSLASWGGPPEEGGGGGQLSPSLLYEMMKKHKGKSEEELKNEADIGREHEKLVAGIFGISAVETLAIAFEGVDFFSRVAGALAPMVPLVGVVLLSASSLLSFYRGTKDRGLDRYVGVHAAWNNLPIQKQKFLCEKLDMKFKLPPWSSYEWLSSWLSPEKPFRSKLEKLFTDDFIKNIKSVIEEMPEIKEKIEEIQEELDNHERRLQSLKRDLEAIREELYSGGTKEVKNEDDLQQLLNIPTDAISKANRRSSSELQQLLNIPTDKSKRQTLVGAGGSEVDEEVRKTIKDIINSASDKVVVLTGEPGAGKTTLLFLLAREIMSRRFKLRFINNVAIFDPVRFQELKGWYAITDLTNQKMTGSFFDRLLQLRGVDTLGRVIVSVRTGYIDKEMLESMTQNERLKLIEVKLEDSVLSEIARRGLQQSMAEQDVDEGVSVLLRKAEGLPIYISEALKVIEEKKKREKREQVSIEELNELPEGIKELIGNILEEEEKISGADIRIAYYLISHARGLPEEYLKAFKEVYNVEEPRFVDMGPDRKMLLHSWYQDVLDEIAKEERLHFNPNTRLGRYLDDIEKSLDKLKEQQKTGPLKPLIEAVNEFERNGMASASLEDMADLMMLAATVHLSIQNLQKDGGKGGFNILFEGVDERKLTAEGKSFFNRLLGFLVNDYLSGKTLARAMQIKDPASRPFYTLSVLYMSRFFDDELAKRVDGEFIGEGVMNPISIQKMFDSYINAPHPLRMYIAALTSVLEKIKFFMPEGHYEKALIHYCKGEYEEAIKEYDIAIDLDPRDASSHGNKGNALQELGRYEEAIKEYDIAIDLDPKNPGYHNNKGIALAYLRRYEEAIKEYDIAIDLDPKNPFYHNGKGIALHNLRRYEEAIKEYDIAIDLDPKNPFYHNNKGNALKDLGRYEEAIKEYEIAIYLDPKNPSYHYNKGIALHNLRRYEEAIKEYEIAIYLDPKNPFYHNGKGIALHNLRRYEEAIKEYDIAIDLDPRDPSYHFGKGIALYALGRYEDAIKEYEIAIDLDPRDPSYHFGKGIALLNLGRYEDAIKEYDIAIDLDPKNPDYHNNKGIALKELGRYEDAIKEYDIAIDLDPKNPSYHYNKGIALHNLRRYEEAIKEYEIAIYLDPKNPDYHNNKGIALYALGRYEDAIKEYEIAIYLDPRDPSYHFGKGNALLNLGRYEDAIKEYDIAIDLNPKNPDYHFGKGIALYALGRYEDAIKEYDIAIDLNTKNPDYHFGKGNALYVLGRYEEAIKEYEIAIYLDPKNPSYHNGKGNALRELGRYEDAIKEYDIAIDLNPKNPGYHYNKGNALKEMGSYSEAMLQVTIGLDLAPYDPYLLLTYAKIKALMGSGSEGINRLAAAIDSKPEIREELCSLARAEIESGRITEEERTMLSKFMDLNCK
ncbi:MAG: tetratricopeptide repeat protein [Candidatus Parvarchaeota archaeon]